MLGAPAANADLDLVKGSTISAIAAIQAAGHI
jgi:hypothetical protein